MYSSVSSTVPSPCFKKKPVGKIEFTIIQLKKSQFVATHTHYELQFLTKAVIRWH